MYIFEGAGSTGDQDSSFTGYGTPKSAATAGGAQSSGFHPVKYFGGAGIRADA